MACDQMILWLSYLHNGNCGPNISIRISMLEIKPSYDFLMIVPVPIKEPWGIWVKSITSNHDKTQQSMNHVMGISVHCVASIHVACRFFQSDIKDPALRRS